MPDDQELREYAARQLDDFADMIDRGPTFDMHPSIFSAMARERAEDIRQADDG